MQLLLLEQQNKKRLRLVKQERERKRAKDGKRVHDPADERTFYQQANAIRSNAAEDPAISLKPGPSRSPPIMPLSSTDNDVFSSRKRAKRNRSKGSQPSNAHGHENVDSNILHTTQELPSEVRLSVAQLRPTQFLIRYGS